MLLLLPAVLSRYTAAHRAAPPQQEVPHFTPKRRSCSRMELHSLLISSSRPSTSARRRRSCKVMVARVLGLRVTALLQARTPRHSSARFGCSYVHCNAAWPLHPPT